MALRICILSRDNIPLGFIDNDIPDALFYYDDTIHTYLAGSANTFTFTAPSNHTDSVLLEVGNKLSFVFDEKPYYMTIMTAEQSETEINVDAWGLSFELLNEQAIEYKATSAMTFEQYLKAFKFENSSLEIGLNEVSDKKIKNEWTGLNDTILARLFSLANVFDAEIEFVPVLNDDYSLKNIKLNIYHKHTSKYQGIGQTRDDMVLRYGLNLEGITKKTDITELYTAIRAQGATETKTVNGKSVSTTITFKSLPEQKINDKNENLEYYKPAGSDILYAPLARDNFPSHTSDSGDKYIIYNWKTDYKDAKSLYDNTLAKLKKICMPKTEYTVNGYITADIGDTLTVSDEGFNPPLYLSCRVTEQEISTTDKSKNKTVFDNVKEQTSKIDPGLLNRMEQLEKDAIEANANVQDLKERADNGEFKGEDGTVLRIDSSRGTVFKNNAVSTVLNVTVFKGGNVIQNLSQLQTVFGNGAYLEWEWQRLDEDDYGIISASDEKLSNNGFSLTLTPEDVDTKVTFRCKLNI